MRKQDFSFRDREWGSYNDNALSIFRQYLREITIRIVPAVRQSGQNLAQNWHAPPAERSLALRYVFALLTTLLALGLTLLFPAIEQTSPFVLLFSALALSAWWGGIGPGLLSLLITIDWGSRRILHNSDPLTFLQAGNTLQIAIFVTAAALLGRATDRMNREAQRAHEEIERRKQLAVVRERLLSGEQAARAEAEAAQARFAFLAEVSNLCSASLNYDAILQRIARLAVGHLADWCVIDVREMTDETERILRLTGAHRDLTQQPLVDTLYTFPPSAARRHPAIKVLQTGKPELIAHFSPQDVIALCHNEEHERLLERLGISSCMVVPLIGRGQTLGTITFVRSTPEFPYQQEDLDLAREMARRAGLSMDNACLYRETQENETRIAALNVKLQRAMTETHHRVKNNLQVISAMVDMQVMEEGDTVSKEELQRIGKQIRTLADVHDILTHQAKATGDAEQISAREILEKLLPMLRSAATNYKFAFQLEEAILPARQGTSLALVANELISNAIKHGRQHVGAQLFVEEGAARLIVCDDGPGFPVPFHPAQAANTGLELVENLSRWDLAGETDYANRPEGGARVTVTIPLVVEQTVSPSRPNKPSSDACQEDCKEKSGTAHAVHYMKVPPRYPHQIF